MSTRARKDRKAAGIRFVHPTKTPTPVTVRSSFLAKSEPVQERIAAARSITLTEPMRKQLDVLRPKHLRPARNYTR